MAITKAIGLPTWNAAGCTSTVTLPPEYELALSKNLAVKLMSKFGKADKLVMADADQINNALEVNNSKRYVKELEIDNALKRRVHR